MGDGERVLEEEVLVRERRTGKRGERERNYKFSS